MRLLMAVVVILVAASLVSALLLEDPGYVLVGFGSWTVESSLAVVVALLVIAFLLLYALLRTVAGMRRVPGRWTVWRRIRRGERARRALARGLIELAEGRWAVAERHLIRHAEQSDTRLLNYLGAARAAQQQGDPGRRDRYLRLAHEAMPEADVAVGLTQADLQISHGQYEQALATAQHLRQVAPRNGQVLKLLTRLYRELRDWERLNELLPELRRQRVLETEAFERLVREVAGARLAAAAGEQDAARLRQIWGGLPREVREDSGMVAVYVRQLIALGEDAAAERLLGEALTQAWDGRLAELYGQVEGHDGGRQLSRAEGWLRAQPQDPALLHALGRLALRNRLWGKARIYLESCVGSGGGAEAHRDLGNLLEQLGDRDAALEYYRRGMNLAAGVAPALPAPEAGTRPAETGDEPVAEAAKTS